MPKIDRIEVKSVSTASCRYYMDIVKKVECSPGN